jgi:uncharacterized protein (TIRG00374 family)
MKHKLTISLIVGILLSLAGFYLAFRNVPANEIIQYFGQINYFWLLPSFGLIVLSFILRVLRWQVILAPTKKIDFWSGFHPVMIAFAINCILPGRVGELARPAILMQREKIRFSTGLATIALERAFDISLIIGLFLVTYPWIEFDPNMSMQVGNTTLDQRTLEAIVRGLFQLGIVLIAGMILVSIEWSRRYMIQLIQKSPNFLFFFSQALREKTRNILCNPLVRLLENFASGFATIQSPSRILLCLLLSILIWLIAALSYYVFSLGCPGVDISLPEMVAVMVIICVFIALPSVPGYWGIWEAGGILAMMAFGVTQTDAAGFTLANHALQVLPVVLLGFISAFVTGINMFQTTTKTDLN